MINRRFCFVLEADSCLMEQQEVAGSDSVTGHTAALKGSVTSKKQKKQNHNISPEFGGLLLSDLQKFLLIFCLLLPQLVVQQLVGSLHLLHVAPLQLNHILSG